MTVLEGTLVRLRPLAPPDYPDVFAWYNDPEIVAPYDRFSVDTFDALAEAVAAAPEDPTSLAPRFAIEPRDGGKVVGVVGSYRAHPVLEYTDVWYVLGDRAARGRGFGRESVRLLTDHLFASSAVERVGATCDVENVPSYRLLEGLGFRHEGTMRSALFHHGRWHDVRVYGLTRAEWATKSPPG
ncbi:MAG: GNAT family protein [Thermoplasmata archaeon]|nr:GNAT family protein [Thermoplasmata archaeon]